MIVKMKKKTFRISKSFNFSEKLMKIKSIFIRNYLLRKV
jgi:hypothetical protein